MSGSSFGALFRVTTFGESHGAGIGAVVDGMPAGIAVDVATIQAALDRRRPGQSTIVSARKEADRVEILSGLFEGRTTGTPIGLLLRNEDADPAAYAPTKDLYRPSHADYTYDAKFGHRDWRGGGRASARETAARVAAGALAEHVLGGIEIVAWVDRIDDIQAAVDPDSVTRATVDAHAVRCPDPEAAARMEARIREVRADGDTVGGVIRGVARGVPAGLGEPVFDKLEAELARAMMSIPAAKGFESGLGYGSVGMRGSTHNDAFLFDGFVRTRTNHAGGIQGGISNGMPVLWSVVFKPVATIFQPQQTVDREGRSATIRPRGRHDACVLPRAVPVVEAMAAIVLADHRLRHRARQAWSADR